MIGLEYSVEKHILKLHKPAKTSRNVFEAKTHWLVKVWQSQQKDIIGVGEAAPLEFLSPDFQADLEVEITKTLNLLQQGHTLESLALQGLPAVKFAIESAMLDLATGGKQIYFQSDYLRGRPIAINGLVWMNDLDAMLEEAFQKVKDGFDCIKFKVGSHDFDAECRFLERFRKQHPASQIQIRLDANGAYLPDEALAQLKTLSRFEIHSIEQPIKKGQFDAMAKLCSDSKIPIALDEELIGVDVYKNGQTLLKEIKPQYLILKPTLLGGFANSNQWIELAEQLNIGWWVTSALEGNIGLNALSQWVGSLNTTMPQGLGTGMLYQNIFPAVSQIYRGKLYYKPKA
jgi:o-succinylbenzoate synthase